MPPELITRLINTLNAMEVSINKMLESQKVPNNFWTKAQAAAYYHCSEKSIDRMMKAGLKYYGITDKPLFRQQDLDAFAEQFKEAKAA